MKSFLGVTWVAALLLGCSAVDEPPAVEGSGGQPGGSQGGSAGGGVVDPSDEFVDTPLEPGPSPTSSETIAPPECSGNCTDLPAQPIIVEGTAVEAGDPAAGFAAASGSGVCLLEPPDGAMMPANWSPPYFEWSGSDSLWEITVESAQQTNQLKAYTNTTSWLFPPEIWFPFAANNNEAPVTVTVRGQSGASSTTTFLIAPVLATGSMVYAALNDLSSMNPNASWLEGLNVGDVNTSEALRTEDVNTAAPRDQGGNVQRDRNPEVTCFGCHTSTPGGSEVAFTDTYPWFGVITSIDEASAGQTPDYLTESAIATISQPWMGMSTFSESVWSAGNRVMISSLGVGDYDPSNTSRKPWRVEASNQENAALAWFDLETDEFGGPLAENSEDAANALLASFGTTFGYIERSGDSRGAMAPDWSNDGTKIVYVSTNCGKDGRLGCGQNEPIPADSDADLYTVPYNDKAGGAATPVSGASESGVWEYYPEFSPDDRFIAFNRVENYTSVPDPGNQGPHARMYYNPNAEVWVVPSAGGQAVRLAANDPTSCDPRGGSSPGVYNSWAKWSPRAVTSASGKTYYWLIFQSARDPNSTFQFQSDNFTASGANSQLYLAGVEVVGGQITRTFPAVYIWAQNPDTLNVTPAWDTFPIPPPSRVPRVR